MADGISFKVDYKPALLKMVAVDRAVDRATMWGLREAGRKVKQAAKKNAPVYKGKRADIPRGRLKNSIHSDKRLGRTAGGYTLRVAPRGFPAQAYAPKMEKRKPFMAPAQAQVSGQATAIFAGAWVRAAKRL